MSPESWLRSRADGALIDVYVQPRAGKSELAGMHESKLKIRLGAPPVDGEANKECVKFLAKLFGIPKSGIEIIQGHKSRHKTLLLRGLSTEEVRQRLEGVVSAENAKGKP